MRVLFDATAYRPEGKGVARYIWNILHQLGRMDPGIEVNILHNRAVKFDNLPLGRNLTLTPVEYPSLVRWKLFCLPKVLEKEHLDVLHCPDQLCPKSPGCKLVITVHELYRRRNAIVPWWRRPWDRQSMARSCYESLFAQTIEHVSRFIAVSNNTRADLLHDYRLDAEMVATVYEAADHSESVSDRDTVDQVPVLPDGYIISFATGDDRERPETVLAAVAEAGKFIGVEPHVVFVGASHRVRLGLGKWARKLGLGERVHAVGFLSDAALRRLMSRAALLVELTRYEGFGLQVLEAMALGVPVVASRCCSIPEIVGSDGLLVDANDVNEVRDAITRYLADESYRRAMSKACQERSRMFSWQRAARQTIQVYLEAVRGC